MVRQHPWVRDCLPQERPCPPRGSAATGRAQERDAARAAGSGSLAGLQARLPRRAVSDASAAISEVPVKSHEQREALPSGCTSGRAHRLGSFPIPLTVAGTGAVASRARRPRLWARQGREGGGKAAPSAQRRGQGGTLRPPGRRCSLRPFRGGGYSVEGVIPRGGCFPTPLLLLTTQYLFQINVTHSGSRLTSFEIKHIYYKPSTHTENQSRLANLFSIKSIISPQRRLQRLRPWNCSGLLCPWS